MYADSCYDQNCTILTLHLHHLSYKNDLAQIDWHASLTHLLDNVKRAFEM